MKLDDKYIEPYVSPKIVRKIDSPKKEEFFVKGETYSLTGESCDDFDMPTQLYELVDIINSVNGVVIDSLVMKRKTQTNSTIFSLTKNDCKCLGIEFEHGLQLLSKNLAWKKINNQSEESQSTEIFNINDLSTYPCDARTKRIHYIMIKLSGFIEEGNKIITPDNQIFPISSFKTNILVRFNRNIGIHQANNLIYYNICTKEITNTNCGEIVDSNGNIYIELCFNTTQPSSFSGLTQTSIKNLSLHNLLRIEIGDDNVFHENEKYKIYRPTYKNRMTQLYSDSILDDYKKFAIGLVAIRETNPFNDNRWRGYR